MRIFSLVWIVFLVSFWYGCNKKIDPKKDDTPTSGEVTIVADEAYRTLLEDFKFLYEIKYSKSELNFIYTSEEKAMECIVSDTVRLAVVSCEPGERELEYFKSKGLNHHLNHVANDAIVLVVHKDFPVNKISLAELKSIFAGEIANLNQLRYYDGQLFKDPANRPNLVLGIPIQGSGIQRYFAANYVPKGKKFPSNTAAFKGTMNLLDSVMVNRNLLGFIGYNYISDKDDSLAKAIKKNFKILSLESLHDSTQFVLPSQSSIADSAYPLQRKVYILNREGKSGLGTGFVIFVSSHKGQRVMLKAGMVPAIAPGREVRFVKKKVKL